MNIYPDWLECYGQTSGIQEIEKIDFDLKEGEMELLLKEDKLELSIQSETIELEDIKEVKITVTMED